MLYLISFYFILYIVITIMIISIIVIIMNITLIIVIIMDGNSIYIEYCEVNLQLSYTYMSYFEF